MFYKLKTYLWAPGHCLVPASSLNPTFKCSKFASALIQITLYFISTLLTSHLWQGR